MEQLKEPRLNVLIVKPLVERLYDEDDVSVGTHLLHDVLAKLTDLPQSIACWSTGCSFFVSSISSITTKQSTLPVQICAS